MTQEEAIKLLINTKVYVQGKSKEVQEKLFSLGFGWKCRDKQVSFTEKPFLFIWTDREICHGDNMIFFTNNTFREISVDDILNIVIDELKYRPFKNAEECFDEMKKHDPFGWLKPKSENYKTFIAEVGSTSVSTYDACYNYEYLFSDFEFIDGTPFGIREN